jgi:2-C-methyl-D-erythritol 4-phosphate cytidylyltransferase
MVEWCVEAFQAVASLRTIVVALPPGHAHDLGDGVEVVPGGAARSESVSNALEAVDTELVAVHDAARPLVTLALIEGVVATLAADPEAAGAIAAAPVADTIKQTPRRAAGLPHQGVEDRPLEVGETLDRARLWAAQTPQVFRTAALRGALAASPDLVAAATDEAMLVEAAGGRVLIHPAPAENIKVTTPLDLRLAEQLLAERSAQ